MRGLFSILFTCTVPVHRKPSSASFLHNVVDEKKRSKYNVCKDLSSRHCVSLSTTRSPRGPDSPGERPVYTSNENGYPSSDAKIQIFIPNLIGFPFMYTLSEWRPKYGTICSSKLRLGENNLKRIFNYCTCNYSNTTTQYFENEQILHLKTNSFFAYLSRKWPVRNNMCVQECLQIDKSDYICWKVANLRFFWWFEISTFFERQVTNVRKFEHRHVNTCYLYSSHFILDTMTYLDTNENKVHNCTKIGWNISFVYTWNKI